MQYIENDWSKYKNQLCKSLQEYCKLKSELTSCVDGIVIKNERIVFPEVLQSENLRYLHIGHFRIEETKARTVVYWIGMNADIAEMKSKCSTCTYFRNKNPKEPLTQTPIPDEPWLKLLWLK